MSYRAAFRCIAGCPGSYALDTIIYRCPTCGGLLEVAHDLDALREHCRTRIAGYKIPRQLLLVDEVPRLPNGKPDYRSAKEQAQARADEA